MIQQHISFLKCHTHIFKTVLDVITYKKKNPKPTIYNIGRMKRSGSTRKSGYSYVRHFMTLFPYKLTY